MQQVDSLERDQAQQEQAVLPPQEGERSGPLSRRREGREAQEVLAGDVGLRHHASPRRRMDVRAVLRSGEALGLKVYFAKPYHSWERGTNENRNGIVRMVFPKGRSFEDILNAELERIDHLLNDRPMKCLDWRTPREAHNALLRRHALADAA